jgi:hypothetical protein
MESKTKQKSIIKIIRNIILSVLALVILIYVIVNIVFWKKGMPERFFEYEVLENDTVEIEYYRGPYFLLNIPETIDGRTVTSIGYHIMWAKDIKEINRFSPFIISVHLPDTVEDIHAYAFEDCTNLRTINMPSNLKRTGIRILIGTKVTKLVFPESMTEIGCGQDIDNENLPCTCSFSEMKYLREIQFPESLKKIGNNAFSLCPSLKKLTIPDSVEEIGYGAFQESGLTEVNIPKSLVTDCGCIFRGTPFEKKLEKEAQDEFVIFNDVLLYKYCGSDENVVIPDGVETLCSRSFWSAPDVKTVELPESIKDINNAFEYSGVTKLLVPDNADPETDMKYEDYRKLRRYKS